MLGCDTSIRKNNIQQKSEHTEDQYVPQEEDLKKLVYVNFGGITLNKSCCAYKTYI